MAIEKKFLNQNIKEFRIRKYIEETLSRVGLSSIKLQRTPLGDKILVRASRPGLVVGRGGSNIQRLTEELKEKFGLEKPQIEIEEVPNPGLDANIVAEMIVNSLERFGSARFKGVGHKALEQVMMAGGLGVEILISGKIPSSRAKTWRFYQGYLKKCGDVAVTGVDIAYKTATLKTGMIGVKVSILPPTTKLPDKIELHTATIEEVPTQEEKESPAVVDEKAVEGEKKPRKKAEPKKAAEGGEAKPKRAPRKKTPAEKSDETPEAPAAVPAPEAPPENAE